MKTTTCKACGRPIVWNRTTKGKSMPCDAEPVAYKEIKGGKEKIVTPNGEVISCTFDAKPEEMTGIGYIPHWSTCPAPPVGRCKDCINATNPGNNIVFCDYFERDVMPDDFCSCFEPREE